MITVANACLQQTGGSLNTYRISFSNRQFFLINAGFFPHFKKTEIYMHMLRRCFVAVVLMTVAVMFMTTAGFSEESEHAGEKYDPQYAMKFDGAADFVVLEGTQDEFQHFLEGRGSISLWVKPSKILIGRSHDNRQFAISAGGSIEPHERDLNVGINERGYWYARLSDGSDYMLGGSSAEPAPKTREWYNIAVVYGGEDRGLYIDGEKMASWDEFSGDTDRWQHDIHIGYAPDRDRNWFGAVRDVRFFDRNLSSAEVREVMKAETLDDEEMGVVGYWPLDEKEGEVAYDKSPGGNHDGRLVGAPKVVLSRPFKVDLESKRVNIKGKDEMTLGPVELRDPEGEVSYQWFRNGMPIEGANESSLVLTDIDVEDRGDYYVQVDYYRELTPVQSNTVHLRMILFHHKSD